MSRSQQIGRALLGALSLLAPLDAARAADVPPDMNFQGRLLDNSGDPLTAPNADLELRIFTQMGGGQSLYRELHNNAELSDGTFSLTIGTGTGQTGTLNADTLNGLNRFLEILVNGELLTPRLPLSSAPYSLRAQQAETVGGTLGTELVSDVQQNASAISGLDATTSSLQGTVNAQATTLNNHTTTLNGHTTSINENTADIGALEATTAGLSTTTAGLQTTVNGHTTTLNNHSTTLNNHTTTINGHTTSINGHTTSINEQAADIATLETQVAGLSGGGFGGDGSAGDLILPNSVTQQTTDWSVTPPPNPNFRNVSIGINRRLVVPAGTTIRCSGTFTNQGTVEVQPGARSRSTDWFPDYPALGGGDSAHPGDSLGPATRGAFILQTMGARGGRGGAAIPKATALTSFNRFRFGGGAGGHYTTLGDGGGLVRIYCMGEISNQFAIQADGASGVSGGGGGGGGIVIIASQTSVNLDGTVSARGGTGGVSTSQTGLGGGGGGGIVLLIAPAPVTGAATPDVAGGSFGSITNPGAVSALPRIAGSGGGACGGSGGDGSPLINANSANIAGGFTNGEDGYVLSILADPASLIE